MTRQEVYEICKRVAPMHGYDPLLILAILTQESTYDPSRPRVEQGYLIKYVVKNKNDARVRKARPHVQSMLATSFGLGQMMGLSLYELGFIASLDSATVARALDGYDDNKELQVDLTCQWLSKKWKEGNGTLTDALRRYNGGADYPPLIMGHLKDLQEAVKKGELK